MKLSKNQAKSAVTAFLLTFAIAAALVALPSVNAHTPPWNIPTWAFVNASPNPWGLGSAEPVLIVFWLNQPPPTAAGTTGDRWRNFTIDITTPSGSVEHYGPFTSDPIGSSYMLYTPKELGTYTITFKFPGQTLSRVGPTGLLGPDSVYVNDTYMPSQATTTLTVTSTPLTYFQEAPLPVSYWTRPINENNQNWNVIASHWLGQSEFGATYLRYNPYGRAPDTAHVMWTYPLSWGGIVGGDHAIVDTMSFYSGTQYQLKFSNPIIMYGIVYFSLPVNNAISGNGVTAVDLRTGQTLWTNPNISSVTFGQLYDFESPNQHGTTGIYLWYTGTAVGTGITGPDQTAINQALGTTSFLGKSYPPGTVDLAAYAAITNSTQPVNALGSWIAVDPQTGKLLFNLTNVPSGTRAYGPQGEWLIYNIGRANSTAPFTYLWQWNNTKLPGNDVPGGITQWLPGLRNWNMSAAYDWNVTLSQPLYPTPAGNPTILQVFPGNLIFGQSSGLQQTPGTASGWLGTPDPFTLWVINLNASRAPIGQVLWQKNFTAPPGNITVSIGPADGETNVATLYYKETMQWLGIDMLTGNIIWGPVPAAGSKAISAWDYYTGTTALTAPIAIGYGRLYVGGYSGMVRAYNLKTGNLDWVFGNDPNNPKNSTLTVETAYGDYPTQVAAVADGKVYLVQEEHSLNAPAYHGAKVWCLNAATGEWLWDMYGKTSWQEVAVADGYFVRLNLDDMRVYCHGPGPSATTVQASPSVVSKGNSVLITGTVTDQSPNSDLKGTAAIADEDQGTWMNYMVTKTIACPTNVKGVPVTLEAVAPDGTRIPIGTVTSDMGGLFKKLWTPPVEGEYTIIATFAGSKSYGPSFAETAIGVTAAPPASPSPSASPSASVSPTPSATASASPSAPPAGPAPGINIYVITAIIVAVAAVLVAAAVVLKRRHR